MEEVCVKTLKFDVEDSLQMFRLIKELRFWKLSNTLKLWLETYIVKFNGFKFQIFKVKSFSRTGLWNLWGNKNSKIRVGVYNFKVSKFWVQVELWTLKFPKFGTLWLWNFDNFEILKLWKLCDFETLRLWNCKSSVELWNWELWNLKLWNFQNLERGFKACLEFWNYFRLFWLQKSCPKSGTSKSRQILWELHFALPKKTKCII
jgi:hypothetical protein